MAFQLLFAQNNSQLKDTTIEVKPFASGRACNDSICSITYCKKGTASYYGRQFQGRRTSSGELFDMNKYTAAHKTLPFGTIVVVTNLSNNKAVVVKINDRMPQWNKREIDLSYAAARTLDYVSSGLTQVLVEIYDPR